MAYIATAYIAMACIVMAYIVMALRMLPCRSPWKLPHMFTWCHIGMAYVVMARLVMACPVMARSIRANLAELKSRIKLNTKRKGLTTKLGSTFDETRSNFPVGECYDLWLLWPLPLRLNSGSDLSVKLLKVTS